MPASVASNCEQKRASTPSPLPAVTASWLAARNWKFQPYFSDWWAMRSLTSFTVKSTDAFSKPSVRMAKMRHRAGGVEDEGDVHVGLDFVIHFTDSFLSDA